MRSSPLAVTSRALVLAAHGSRSEEGANALVEEHAARLRRRGAFDEVRAAFHLGDPPFSEVLDRLRSSRVTLVPFMTSAGYYARVVLPRELRKNRRLGEVELSVTDPIGLHRGLPELLARRLAHLSERFALAARRTAVAVVGHGTERHAESSRSTIEMARRLAEEGPCEAAAPFFLDESPGVEGALDHIPDRDLVVLPFLVGGGSHVSSDLPRRLGLSSDEPAGLPLLAEARGRRVVIDRPLGELEPLTDLLLDAAMRPL